MTNSTLVNIFDSRDKLEVKFTSLLFATSSEKAEEIELVGDPGEDEDFSESAFGIVATNCW